MQSMVGSPFDLLGDPVSGECFEGLDDACMQGPPSVLWETPVGHVVGEGMLDLLPENWATSYVRVLSSTGGPP